MKTKIAIVALVSILFALTAIAFMTPVPQAVTTEEATACPGDLCVINNADRNAGGVVGQQNYFCQAFDAESCDYCCNWCLNHVTYDRIVGSEWCWCTRGAQEEYCPP